MLRLFFGPSLRMDKVGGSIGSGTRIGFAGWVRGAACWKRGCIRLAKMAIEPSLQGEHAYDHSRIGRSESLLARRQFLEPDPGVPERRALRHEFLDLCPGL